MFDYFDYLSNDDLAYINRCAPHDSWQPIAKSNRRAFYRYNDGRIELLSYQTIIASYNTETGEIRRHWNGCSVTSMRHMQMFMCMLNGETYRRNTSFGKKVWESMPVTE